MGVHSASSASCIENNSTAECNKLLQQLNFSTSTLPFTKLSDLAVQTPLLITECSIITTQFGNKVCCILDETKKIILPLRFLAKVEANPGLLEFLNSGKVIMIYKGLISKPGIAKMHDIEFYEIPSSSSSGESCN